jgi:hypothetical protein
MDPVRNSLPLLQPEAYSPRAHFCQVVCDYGMILIWAVHETKVGGGGGSRYCVGTVPDHDGGRRK